MASKDELLGILKAYKLVHDASWPTLNPTLAERAARWPTMPSAQLEAELAALVSETNANDTGVRVFWKLGPEFTYGGCNAYFASDAGLARPSEIVGINDFNKLLPWRRQAAKYRSDDRDVVTSRQPKLNILERQDSATGLIYVLTGKSPVLLPSGEAVGILGMYEMIDAARAAEIYSKQVTAAAR